MQFVCDAGRGKTWFRIETEDEAAKESELMRHAVEKYFRRELAKARENYRPVTASSIERDIGLKAHLARSTPLFLTLRDDAGDGLATAMLPPGGRDDASFSIVIVGPANADPYVDHGKAIAALAAHVGFELPRARCFPYARDED